MDQQSCTAQQQCFYPGERCDCGGMMDDLKWHCRGSGAACPPMVPAADSSCDNGMEMPLACPYPDGSECHCNDGHWRCDMPPEPGAGGAPPEPPGPHDGPHGPPGPPAGGAPEMPEGGRPGPGDPGPGGRAG